MRNRAKTIMPKIHVPEINVNIMHSGGMKKQAIAQIMLLAGMLVPL